MLSEDVATYLAAEGLGTLGTTISSEIRPSPDDLMVVRQYEGAPATFTKDQGGSATRVNPPKLEYPRLQVLCRSKDTQAAMQRASSVRAKLNGFRGLLSGTLYRIREVGTGPFAIGRDESSRERVVCNFEVIR
jgi:hypothetical protein